MKSKFLKLALTLFVFGLFTGMINVNSAFCQNKGAKKPAGKEMLATKGDEKSENSFDELKFTPEQKKSIFELHAKLIKSVTPIKDVIGEKKAHLKSLSHADNPDMSAINASIDEIASLKAQIAKLHVANHFEVCKLLTDEQKVMFDARGIDHERNHQGMQGNECENQHGKLKSKDRQGIHHSKMNAPDENEE